MGYVKKTPAGTFRANWRDAAGRQKAKTFKTKKEASAFLAETEASINRGTYVNPHAGRIRFGEYAAGWLANRRQSARTNERTQSVMRTHVLPHWQDWPLYKIDHSAVQAWVTDLGGQLAPATVGKCFGVLSAILRSAVRDRRIGASPADGVKAPSTYTATAERVTISREEFFGKLLPALEPEHRAFVCTTACSGLRWGEVAGLPWGAVDLDRGRLRVVQVAVETSSAVTIKRYPKSRAGVRTVPLPPFVVDLLRERRSTDNPEALVFATRTGSPLRRSNFRRQVWRPALVRAGLLGRIVQRGEHRFTAVWPDSEGTEWTVEFTTEREAVALVAEKAAGGLRFHDLRHSYATWLVSDGLPVNVVQRVMGHEQATTTLGLYTHAPNDYDDRVAAAFAESADFLLTIRPDQRHSQGPDDDDQGDEQPE